MMTSLFSLLLVLLLSSNCLAADWPSTELECLSSNIYYEARSESVHGQWLVAYVTHNRVVSKKFPNTYCGVVKQPKQFSWYNSKVKLPTDRKAWEQAYLIASHFINNDEIARIDASMGALFYHTIAVRPYWSKQFKLIGRVDHHLAYK